MKNHLRSVRGCIASCLVLLAAFSLSTCKKKSESEKKKIKSLKFPIKGLPTSTSALGPASFINVAGGLNLAKLRSTPFWQMFMSQDKVKAITMNPMFVGMTRRCNFDPFKQLDMVTVGLTSPHVFMLKGRNGPQNNFVVLLSGRFKAHAVFECLKGLAAGDKSLGTAFKPTTIEGKSAISITDASGTFVALPVKDDTLAVAAEPLAKVAVSKDPLFGSARIKKMTQGLAESMMFWMAISELVVPTDKVPAMMRSLTEVKAISFFANIQGEQLSINLNTIMDSPETVEAVKRLFDLVKSFSGMAQGKLDPKKQAAMKALENVKIHSEGSSLQFGIELDPNSVSSLLKD